MDCWGRERELVFNTFLQVAHTDFFRFFFSSLVVIIFISFSLKMSNHELISAISDSKWTYSWGTNIHEIWIFHESELVCILTSCFLLVFFPRVWKIFFFAVEILFRRRLRQFLLLKMSLDSKSELPNQISWIWLFVHLTCSE